MATLGYARVSTNGQDLTAQIEALKAAGAATIYREKVSGVRANRPELAKLMAKLMPDDLVIVTKLEQAWPFDARVARMHSTAVI